MSDTIDLKSPTFQKNRRKIYKWVFLLLKEHHERLGLKVTAWSGPEGIGTPRLSFFFERLRQQSGSPEYHFALASEQVGMQMYQWNVGVFQPLPGHPQLVPEQSTVELRTKKMLPWFNEQLRIIPIYQTLGDRLLPEKVVENWQQRAERYLHSWNVLGMYLAKKAGFVRLESIGGTGWSYVEPAYIKDAQRFLSEARQEDILIFEKGPDDWLYWLHTGRIVRRNGESLDFFQLSKGGMPLEKVVDRVSHFVGDSIKGDELN